MKFGIDRIREYPSLFQGKRVGLVTSVSGIGSSLHSSVEILGRECRLAALFGPEHGIMGERPAGEKVESYTDERTGLPVYSLYGEKRHLQEEAVRELDLVVYDIQDIGVRYYTYISTLLYLLEDCERFGLPLVVLDRPNPLGGTQAEGNTVKEGYCSFVGAHDICIRHGMTAGELAAMFRQEKYPGCELHVVPCGGWERSMQYPDTDTLWIPPSPNVPNFETALLYPGTCLFEGTNLSEGRGTARPFSYIGAPFVPAEELARRMNAMRLPGAAFTPVYFTPCSSKHEGVLCSGVQVHVTDRLAVRPAALGVTLLAALQELCGDRMQILDPPKEGGRPFLSLLFGEDILCRPGWYQNGGLETLLSRMEEESAAFERRKAEYHLYS